MKIISLDYRAATANPVDVARYCQYFRMAAINKTLGRYLITEQHAHFQFANGNVDTRDSVVFYCLQSIYQLIGHTYTTLDPVH